jgi:hypothetical protein
MIRVSFNVAFAGPVGFARGAGGIGIQMPP